MGDTTTDGLFSLHHSPYIGMLITPADFDKKLCFEDLPTTGVILIFSEEHDISNIIECFNMETKESTYPQPYFEPSI
tara:strand:- start:1728 stop:1958 length:231 start_codon:yes stop_codon:yes gene_type:complete